VCKCVATGVAGEEVEAGGRQVAARFFLEARTISQQRNNRNRCMAQQLQTKLSSTTICPWGQSPECVSVDPVTDSSSASHEEHDTMDTFLQRSAPHHNTVFLFYLPPIITHPFPSTGILNSQPLRSRQHPPRHISVRQAVRQYRNAGFSGTGRWL
jgi:hypothetical protein